MSLSPDPNVGHVTAGDGAADIGGGVQPAVLQLAAVRSVPVQPNPGGGDGSGADLAAGVGIPVDAVRELRGLLRTLLGRGQKHLSQPLRQVQRHAGRHARRTPRPSRPHSADLHSRTQRRRRQTHGVASHRHLSLQRRLLRLRRRLFRLRPDSLPSLRRRRRWSTVVILFIYFFILILVVWFVSENQLGFEFFFLFLSFYV